MPVTVARGKALSLLLADSLSRQNIAIISGMAKGTDSYAHTAAIEADAYTVAVIGTGPEKCYPNEHQELMRRIIATGAIISEFPPLIPGHKAKFYQKK